VNSQGKFWLLFGGLWLGVGLLFAAVGGLVLWLESEREARLARDGASASAVVLAKNTAGGGQNRERTFGIDYRFTGPDGASREHSAKVDAATWRQLSEGQAFELRYVRDEPSIHAFAGERREHRVIGPLFAALGSAFAIAGALILWRATARRALVERLRIEGMRVDGEVTEVGPTNFRVNRMPQWAVRYRYRDQVGNVHESRTPPMPQEEARQWQPGDRGEVRFDTNRPTRHVWLGRDS
jgi:hypothetical protein